MSNFFLIHISSNWFVFVTKTISSNWFVFVTKSEMVNINKDQFKQEDYTCCICQEDCSNISIVIFSCDHFVCGDCWIELKLVTISDTCPLCRKEHGSLRTINLYIDDIILKIENKAKIRNYHMEEQLDDLDITRHDKENIKNFYQNQWNSLLQQWGSLNTNECQSEYKRRREYLQHKIDILETRIENNNNNLLNIKEQIESITKQKAKMKTTKDTMLRDTITK